MDEDPGWRALESGELLHVDGELNVSVTTAIKGPPAHQLALQELDARAAASQTHAGGPAAQAHTGRQ
jgi:glutamine amidotransferase